MILFQECAPIRAHGAFTKANQVTWYTWADCFIKERKALTGQFRRLSHIDFLYMQKFKEYNYSYSVDLQKLDTGFVAHFRNYALSLYHFSPGIRVVFFRDLIDERIDGKLFHFIFALFRSLLVEITADEMGALYSPLSPGKKESDFPLHCDLYIPKTLFNVFENVASDNSGHSTFLPLDTFFREILPAIPGVLPETIDYLSDLVNKDVRSDNYEKFYSALYGDEIFSKRLRRLQNKHKWKIRLRKGEGYMLNDRIWMHGRDKTHGAVSSKRLHRLIYNNFLAEVPFTP